MKQARWYLVGADTSDGAALLYSQGDLEVLDTETEEVRWRLELFADLPGGDGAKWMLSNFDHGRPWLVEHDGEPAVLTEYFKPVCTRGGYCPGTPDDKAESGLVLRRARTAR